MVTKAILASIVPDVISRFIPGLYTLYGEEFDFCLKGDKVLLMRPEQSGTSSVEELLQSRLNELLKSGRKNGDFNSLSENGFVYIDDSESLVSGPHFYILANSKSGETIREMYETGKLPSTLTGHIDAQGNGDVPVWQITDFLTSTAQEIGIADFRELAASLKISNSKDLDLYKFDDPRNLWQKIVDSF